MNKILAICIMVVCVGVWISISVSAPWILDDSNTFLSDFVNHELLNVLGIILAITLASAANLHLQFNQMEDSIQKKFLTRTRNAVGKSSIFLVFAFVAAIALVVIKPLLPQSPLASSLANGFAVLLLIANVLILVDIIKLVFKIPPMFEVMKSLEDERKNEGDA